MSMMEEYNYWMDNRTISSMVGKAYEILHHSSIRRKVRLRFSESLAEILIEDGLIKSDEVEIPESWEVCGCCSGRGKVVNPSIDASGIQACEFEEDPDFRDAYFSGEYDIRCPECKGERVTLSIEYMNPEIKKAVVAWEREEMEYARQCARERAMGA